MLGEKKVKDNLEYSKSIFTANFKKWIIFWICHRYMRKQGNVHRNFTAVLTGKWTDVEWAAEVSLLLIDFPYQATQIKFKHSLILLAPHTSHIHPSASNTAFLVCMRTSRPSELQIKHQCSYSCDHFPTEKARAPRPHLFRLLKPWPSGHSATDSGFFCLVTWHPCGVAGSGKDKAPPHYCSPSKISQYLHIESI